MTQYWIVPSGPGATAANRVLHTDPECRYIKRAGRLREPFETELERLDVCQQCTGEAERQTQGDRSHYEALLDAAGDNGGDS